MICPGETSFHYFSWRVISRALPAFLLVVVGILAILWGTSSRVSDGSLGLWPVEDEPAFDLSNLRSSTRSLQALTSVRTSLKPGTTESSPRLPSPDKHATSHVFNFDDPPAVFRPDNLQLYVRLNSSRGWGEARSYLLPSLQMFWPHSKLLVVLDQEDPVERVFANNVAEKCKEFQPVVVKGVTVPPPTLPGIAKRKNAWGVQFLGYYQGQMDMLYADKITTSKYVAFVDTDTVFTTLVTPESIFADSQKPRIIGMVHRTATGARDADQWRRMYAPTTEALKRPYTMGCMNMFPVVVYTKHLAALRRHMAKIHGKSFLEAYVDVWSHHPLWCHFTILCNYLWYYHRADYDFHFQSAVHWRQGWQNLQDDGANNDASVFNKVNRSPLVRVSIHAAYAAPEFLDVDKMITKTSPEKGFHLKENRYEPFLIQTLLVRGFCFAATSLCSTSEACDRLRQVCRSVQFQREPFLPFFRFEVTYENGWFSDQRDIEAQRRYEKSLAGQERWLVHAGTVLEQRTKNKKWSDLATSIMSVSKHQTGSRTHHNRAVLRKVWANL